MRKQSFTSGMELLKVLHSGIRTNKETLKVADKIRNDTHDSETKKLAEETCFLIKESIKADKQKIAEIKRRGTRKDETVAT